MKKLLIPILIVAAVVAVVIFLRNESSVAVQNDYGSKVVYASASTDEEKESYRKDCSERGGTFLECGTPCAPDAQFCVQVCAFTCENINAN